MATVNMTAYHDGKNTVVCVYVLEKWDRSFDGGRGNTLLGVDTRFYMTSYDAMNVARRRNASGKKYWYTIRKLEGIM